MTRRPARVRSLGVRTRAEPRFLVVALCAAAIGGGTARAEEHEPTDIHIRRLAGLPADGARGQIEILDVGHDPLSTMLSIVARRVDGGWSVSYACAGSPACAPDADHRAVAYTLSPPAAAEVDAILATLKRGKEPDGQRPSGGVIGGWLNVSIDDGGFRRDYSRVLSWGRTLGRLEALLTPAAP